MTHTAAATSRKVADLIWDRVAERLAGGAAALLPIGAGAKQHGLHMTMATDQVFAEYFATVVAEKTGALIWPTLTYGAYPAFVAYAGSASLSDCDHPIGREGDRRCAAWLRRRTRALIPVFPRSRRSMRQSKPRPIRP